MFETKALASYIVKNRWEDIPEDVRHEARRSLINVIGCAIGGSPHPAVTTAIRALSPFSGERIAASTAGCGLPPSAQPSTFRIARLASCRTSSGISDKRLETTYEASALVSDM